MLEGLGDEDELVTESDGARSGDVLDDEVTGVLDGRQLVGIGLG